MLMLVQPDPRLLKQILVKGDPDAPLIQHGATLRARPVVLMGQPSRVFPLPCLPEGIGGLSGVI